MTVLQLYELQQVDTDIDTREKSLAEARSRLGEDPALLALGRRIQELEKRLKDEALARRPVELEIRGLEERLAVIEARLYGGSITNAKELEAQNEELTYLKEQRSAEEDRLLELMVTSEETQNEFDVARKTVAEIEDKRKRAQPDLTANEEALRQELDRLAEERVAVAGELAGSELSMYDALRKSRGGQAVARVERGICEGCRLSLPSTEVQRARISSGPVHCSSCRRILFVP